MMREGAMVAGVVLLLELLVVIVAEVLEIFKVSKVGKVEINQCLLLISEEAIGKLKSVY